MSYVYPDGFFPLEESDLTDKSAVAGLRGDMGDWSGDLGFGYGEGRFAFGAANSINPSYAAEYLARNPGADGASIAANAGPADVFSGGLNVRQWTLNADANTGDRGWLDSRVPGYRRRLPAGPRNWMEPGDRALVGLRDPATPRAAFPRPTI